MRIYKAEQKAGIAFEINKAGSSSSFVTAKARICDVEKYFDGMSVLELLKSTNTVQTVEELLGEEQPDLALIVSILVSTGWNLNDDIFTPEELWKARSSPLHKPMNDNHDIGKILGHIVQSRILDKSGNEIKISEDQSPPDEFDIEVAGVLYRQFSELTERIDEIIEKAKSGEIFVSMEAWFPDFGYGLVNAANGNVELVERTEETAFLTKHLKVYGGSGDYQGFKVGRVLKNIIFGAQGFVDEPANPESVIKVAADKKAVPSVFVTAKLDELLEGGVEDMDEAKMKELQARLKEVELNLSNKESELVELKEKVTGFETQDSDKQITVLTTKVEELTASFTEASEKIDVLVTERDELQKKFDESDKRADKTESELNEIRKIETARERFEKLSEIKTIDDKEVTLAELSEMTDETFEAVLKYAGQDKSQDSSDSEKDSEKAEAALNNVEEKDKNSPDFNVQEDIESSKAEKWSAMANKLCGKDEKEGGE